MFEGWEKCSVRDAGKIQGMDKRHEFLSILILDDVADVSFVHSQKPLEENDRLDGYFKKALFNIRAHHINNETDNSHINDFMDMANSGKLKYRLHVAYGSGPGTNQYINNNRNFRRSEFRHGDSILRYFSFRLPGLYVGPSAKRPQNICYVSESKPKVGLSSSNAASCYWTEDPDKRDDQLFADGVTKTIQSQNINLWHKRNGGMIQTFISVQA